MIKSIIVVLLLSLTLSASSSKSEKKIYGYLLHSIFPAKSTIHVWTDDSKKKEILNGNDIVVVENLEDADIVFVYHTKELETKKILFTGSYKLLKRYVDQAIGGFFWLKGRANIVFLKTNLEKEQIKLPQSLEKYIQEDL